MGNWDEVTEVMRQTREADLRCPKCGAQNIPRAGSSPSKTYIELRRDWTAECAVCSHAWAVERVYEEEQ